MTKEPKGWTAERRPESKGWTAERRQAQRERMLALKPWEKSTGPKSLMGKMISSGNARKHGAYSAQTKAIKKLLRDHRQFRKNFRVFYRYVLENQVRFELKNELIRELRNSTTYAKTDSV